MAWGEASSGAGLGRPGPLSEGGSPGRVVAGRAGRRSGFSEPFVEGSPRRRRGGEGGDRREVGTDGNGGSPVGCYLPRILSLLRRADPELCSGRVCSVVGPAEMQGQDLK